MSIRMKPGDTLEWDVTDSQGDLTGTTIEAALSSGSFYYPLTVTPVDLTIGSYTLTAASTVDFPIGRMNGDLKYSVSDTVVRTNTFSIYVDKGITK